MIIFSHLLNDRSGSPKILSAVISCLSESNEGSQLFVGSDGTGCLSDVDIATTQYWYRHTPYRFLTVLTYFYSQFSLLVKLLFAKNICRNATIYVNTLLPFGAALFGRITGRRVVYHLHEVSIGPAPLKWFLTAVARYSASDLIYVSEFHRKCLPIRAVQAHTICNALDVAFLKRAEVSCYKQFRKGYFTILMLASLRDYKGIPEFLVLADTLLHRSDIKFELVCNEDEGAVKHYFREKIVPLNVLILPRTSDTASHYGNCSLVLNLSRPNEWIETFGLTLLEAMAFGVPVIAPPVGGPAEIVTDGVEGFLIPSYDVERIANMIGLLVENEDLALELSRNARKRAYDFTLQQFESRLKEVIGG